MAQNENFSGHFILEISRFEGKDLIEENTRNYSITPEKIAISTSINKKAVRLIFERKSSKRITIMLEEKMGVVTKKEEKKNELKSPNYKIKKTDEKKEINGYKCQKFLLESSSQSVEVWLTKDIIFDFFTYLESYRLIDDIQQRNLQFLKTLPGFVIQATTTFKGSNEKIIMEFKDLKIPLTSLEDFDLSNFKMFDMR